MPAHSETAGSIILEDAYALSKMLESSGWNGLLPRKITPSDVDLCFDNDGSVIYCDFSNNCASWDQLALVLKGQRRLYESLIRDGPHCAVLCKHSVAPKMGRKIDTLRDVEQFQVMVWDFEPVLSPILEQAHWKSFVQGWFAKDGPIKIRRRLLGGSAGMIIPPSPNRSLTSTPQIATATKSENHGNPTTRSDNSHEQLQLQLLGVIERMPPNG